MWLLIWVLRLLVLILAVLEASIIFLMVLLGVMIRIKIFGLLATTLSLVLLLGFTKPQSASLLTHALVFLNIYFICLLFIWLIIDLGYPRQRNSLRLFASITLAFTPTILIAQSSLSGISILDCVFAIGLPVVIVWYFIRVNTIK